MVELNLNGGFALDAITMPYVSLKGERIGRSRNDGCVFFHDIPVKLSSGDWVIEQVAKYQDATCCSILECRVHCCLVAFRPLPDLPVMERTTKCTAVNGQNLQEYLTKFFDKLYNVSRLLILAGSFISLVVF